ncbi:MAG: alpha/beta hydrolase [Paenibacillus sp.]|jgi:pimeloyl-ACP methyl ester carboxylesterase|nr:alpha/beta hydrolase [Paenibacillus sp.]
MKTIAKKKIRTTDGTFEFSLSVKEAPAIILINGGSGPIEGWYKVFHELAQENTIMAYNRLGVGGSSKPTSPQHGTAIVTSLKQLLDDIGLPPPYLLVGHSLGGLYANLFARKFPHQVSGVVLLEASHPQDLKINDTQPVSIRILNRALSIIDILFPSRQWNEVHYVEQTAAQIEQAGPFPDKPLLVVSGTKKPPFMPEQAFEIRMNNQLDFVQLSKKSKQIRATRSGHFPQLTEPDLVIQAIQECIHMK